jgi:hypothetical protein
MQKEKQSLLCAKKISKFQLLYVVWQKGNACGVLKEGDIKEVVIT